MSPIADGFVNEPANLSGGHIGCVLSALMLLSILLISRHIERLAVL